MPFAGSVVVPTRARGQWTKATRKVTIIGAFNHIRSTFGSWRASDPLNRGDEFVVPPADHEDDMALDAMDALTNDITRGFLPTMHHAEEKVEVMGMAGLASAHHKASSRTGASTSRAAPSSRNPRHSPVPVTKRGAPSSRSRSTSKKRRSSVLGMMRRSSVGRTIFGRSSRHTDTPEELEEGLRPSPGRRQTAQELIEGTKAAQEEHVELLEFPPDTFLVNPNGRFFVCWSGTMFPCIVYAAVVTPFEIAFIDDSCALLAPNGAGTGAIRRRFNASVPRARVSENASTRRGRSER
jgi:hypothetical protein